MSIHQIAKNLRQNQSKEEKDFWRALRGRRFAGFKFRRQHTLGGHILDFYCADAKLAIELDGFQHGRPDVIQKDQTREKCLAELGVEILRFWNHQWRKNREGCLLEIWNALQQRTGCIRIMKNTKDHRFVTPEPQKIDTSLSRKHTDSKTGSPMNPLRHITPSLSSTSRNRGSGRAAGKAWQRSPALSPES